MISSSLVISSKEGLSWGSNLQQAVNKNVRTLYRYDLESLVGTTSLIPSFNALLPLLVERRSCYTFSAVLTSTLGNRTLSHIRTAVRVFGPPINKRNAQWKIHTDFMNWESMLFHFHVKYLLLTLRLSSRNFATFLLLFWGYLGFSRASDIVNIPPMAFVFFVSVWPSYTEKISAKDALGTAENVDLVVGLGWPYAYRLRKPSASRIL